MKKCGIKKIKSRKGRIHQTKTPPYSYKKYGKGVRAHADQIRPQVEYEEQNVEDISTIPSVNDLLEQPLHNETPEDEIMHDQVGQNKFENSDKD